MQDHLNPQTQIIFPSLKNSNLWYTKTGSTFSFIWGCHQTIFSANYHWAQASCLHRFPSIFVGIAQRGHFASVRLFAIWCFSTAGDWTCFNFSHEFQLFYLLEFSEDLIVPPALYPYFSSTLNNWWIYYLGTLRLS